MKKIFKKINNKKGFTLVEFVVVISIFAIMTSISMANYNNQRTAIETSNLAEDIALTIRQAQVYGISASGYNLGAPLDINDEDALFDADLADAQNIKDITSDKSIRGVVFNLVDNEIILYEDNNRDYIYRDGDDRVIDKRKIVSKNISFQSLSLCDSLRCQILTEGIVDITFKRPYPDAIIHYRENISNKGGELFSTVDVVVGGEGSAFKYIHVNSIGNIAVKSQ